MLNIFLTKIMAAIFDSMAVEGWGEKKFVPRGRLTVKNKGRGGDGAGRGGGEDLECLLSYGSQL